MSQFSNQKSPYLQQHKHNPVKWQMWSESTLRQAQKKNLPLFISIGYSTCHWCHVMARECFANEEIAAIINQNFLPIKIDREERPDMDNYYLISLQVQGINGGWPLNVFALPDGRPFFGGTYFPPVDKAVKFNIPSFKEVLQLIIQNWHGQRDKVVEQAQVIAQAIKRHSQGEAEDKSLQEKAIFLAELQQDFFLEDKEFQDIHLRYYDQQQGGYKFQSQNKFANFLNLLHLLKIAQHEKNPQLLQQVISTTNKISWGGIYDHLGGGIARYSTDYEWKVPHFEKMLYDQTLYLLLLKDLYLINHDEFYPARAYQVIDYLEREMRSPKGGFYSAQDADSNHVEGEYYLWDYQEISRVLDPQKFKDFYDFYSLTPAGNYQGKIIFHSSITLFDYAQAKQKEYASLKVIWTAAIKKLEKVRHKRKKPQRDDKVILAWNALAIVAYATWGRSIKDKKLIREAEKCLLFIQSYFFRSSSKGTCYRRVMDNEGQHWALLEDYALLGLAAIELYESTANRQHLNFSQKILKVIFSHFYHQGEFFRNQLDQKDILFSQPESYDGVEPAGHSALVHLLFKWSYYGENPQYAQQALRIVERFYSGIKNTSFPFMLSALHDYKRGYKEITITDRKWLQNPVFYALINQSYFPERIIHFDFSNKKKGTSLTVCKKNSCLFPTQDLKIIKNYLEI